MSGLATVVPNAKWRKQCFGARPRRRGEGALVDVVHADGHRPEAQGSTQVHVTVVTLPEDRAT